MPLNGELTPSLPTLYHHTPSRHLHYLAALEKLAALLPEPARSIVQAHQP